MFWRVGHIRNSLRDRSCPWDRRRRPVGGFEMREISVPHELNAVFPRWWDEHSRPCRSEFRSIGVGRKKLECFCAENLLASAAGQKCTNDTLDILRGTMPRLPPQYAPLVYGIIQSAITTAVASAIAVGQLTGIGVRFLVEWLSAWSLAFLIMLPVVVFVAPLISALRGDVNEVQCW